MLFPAVAVFGSSAPEMSDRCPAGSSHCDEGTVLLQKGHKTKKVNMDAIHKVNASEGVSKPSGEGGGLPSSVFHEEVSMPSVAHVTLGKYPGYTGKVKIRGEVNISVVKGSVALAWDFTGTETKCRTVHLSPANACGLHIHEGKTCGDKAKVGGHLYAPPIGHYDPWASIVYTTYKGNSEGSTSLKIGKSMNDIVGRAFVVHDHQGARVACGLITVPPPGESAAIGMRTSFAALLAMVMSLHLSY